MNRTGIQAWQSGSVNLYEDINKRIAVAQSVPFLREGREGGRLFVVQRKVGSSCHPGAEVHEVRQADPL